MMYRVLFSREGRMTEWLFYKKRRAVLCAKLLRRRWGIKVKVVPYGTPIPQEGTQ